MAKDFFKIKKGLTLPRVSLPSSGDDGDIVNTTEGFYIYKSGDWRKLAITDPDTNYFGASGNPNNGPGNWVVSTSTIAWTSTVLPPSSSPFGGDGSYFQFANTGTLNSGDNVSLPFVLYNNDKGKILKLSFDAHLDATAADNLAFVIRDLDTNTDVYSKSMVSGLSSINENVYLPNSNSSNYSIQLRIINNSVGTLFARFSRMSLTCGVTSNVFDGRWPTYYGDVVSATFGGTLGVGTANPVLSPLSCFRPFQDANGDWFMWCTGRVTFDAINVTNSARSVTMTINGVTIKSPGNFSISVGGSVTNVTHRGSAVSADSNHIECWINQAGSVSTLNFAGMLALTGKPTWATFEPPQYQLTNNVLRSNAQLLVTYGTTSLSDSTNITPSSIVVEKADGIEWDAANAKAIIKASGRYRVGASHRVTTAAGATEASYASVEWRKNTNNTANRLCTSFGRIISTLSQSSSTSKDVDLLEGDELYLRIASNNTVASLQNAGLSDLQASITRLPDISADAPIGFGVARDNNPGLIPAYAEGTWTPSFTAAVNLDGNPTLVTATYTKIGRMVFCEFVCDLGVTNANIEFQFVFPWASLPFEAANVRDIVGQGYRKNSGARTVAYAFLASPNETNCNAAGTSNSTNSGPWYFSFSYRALS